MNLYRILSPKRTLTAGVALLLIAMAGLAVAQTQKRKPHKLRATALVELTTDRSGNVKALLTPICILADGRFEDASIYKATPQPMAIESGIVYEAQKTGVTAGFMTVTNSNKGSIWTALGRWQVFTAVAKKAEPAPATVSSTPNDGRPHLKRPGESSGSSPASSPTPDSGSSGSTSPGSTSSSDDRPKLHRPDENPSSSPTPTPDTSSSGTSGSGSSSDDRPKLHRPNESASPSPTPSGNPPSQASPQSASQPTVEPAPPDDADRPVLRHRSPSAAAAAATPAATPVPAAKASGSKATPQGTVPSTSPKPPDAGTQTMVAVSDNQTSESRSYAFIWKAGEQEQMDAKMRKLALAQLPKENSQLNDGSFRNVVIRSFDLDLSNDAVMVLTAEIPGSYMAPATKTAGAKKAGTKKAGTTKSAGKTSSENAGGESAPGKFVSRYITLIARVDFEGVPQRLAVSVTDSSRLDVAPRLELIDAVDVDGDGLAELLFREYGFDQKGFIVYGIGRSTVTKVFEGATEDLKVIRY